MLDVAFDRFFKNGAEGLCILATSLMKEWIHLKSDINTKNSLPFPIISTISPDLANSFAEYGFDMGNIIAVSKQALYAEAINVIVGMLHGIYCFYTQKDDISNNAEFSDSLYFKHQNEVNILELSKVRTRKILLLSNLIASSSNVIAVAIMQVNEAGLEFLDIGGLAVTLYRLISDIKFINQVKEEFLEKEWYNAVVGEDYQFIAEVNKMGKKDIIKGIEIQAKADAAKAEKVADGLAVHANILNNIKDTQHEVHQKVDIVIQDKCDQEAADLYGLKVNKKLLDLDYTEKRVLSAAIYTLMAASDTNSELQKKFFECIESYGVSERVDNFDFDNLRNIDSFSDRKIILKAICAFLFLQEFSFDFANNEKYSWLAEFTSKRDVDEVCKDIEKEFSILGGDGIVNGYLPPLGNSENVETKELPEAEEVQEREEDSSSDYSQLFEVIGKVGTDEKAYGKHITKIDQAFVDRELGKEYPKVSAGAVIAATRIANGCLLFTTYALYLRTGNILNGKYIRLPYQRIISEKIHTGEGKLRGTRKLIIPYKDVNDKCVSVEIDDILLEEEKLRDLLIEITSLACSFPVTDENINFADLDNKIKIVFFNIVASILKKGRHTLTELYLLLRDFDLQDEWNDIAACSVDDNLDNLVDEFINNIPYPSELFITEKSMQIIMRTIGRTNGLENREPTVLTKDEEELIKRFDTCSKLSDIDFNILFKNCAKEQRTSEPNELTKIIDEVMASDIHSSDSVVADIRKLIDIIKAQEEAKQNTPVAKFRRAVQNKAIPKAKEVFEKAEEHINRMNRKNEILNGDGIYAYPITTDETDEYLANPIISEAVKKLQSEGIDARIHIAQGTIFGYVFCKADEIDAVAEKLSNNKRCTIVKYPVDKFFKKNFLDSYPQPKA